MGYKRRTNPQPLPELPFTSPMECVAVLTLPEGSRWTYEVKHDGYRLQVVHNPGGVRLYSRSGRDLTGFFARFLPELSVAVPSGAKLDGELVALDVHGNPSFQLLQLAATSRTPLVFFAFDMLALAGRDLTQRTLSDRRYMLQTFLRESDGVQLTQTFDAPASEILRTARGNNLEGIVAKRDDSVYEPGRRSGAWSKVRFSRKQEFVLGGFTRGSYGFDEVAIGFYRSGQLRFCSLVRNGFLPEVRRAIHSHLLRLISKSCPFSNFDEIVTLRSTDPALQRVKQCVWVQPQVVGQFGFLEWTADGQLLNPKFLGLRDDKNPRSVIREL